MQLITEKISKLRKLQLYDLYVLDSLYSQLTEDYEDTLFVILKDNEPGLSTMNQRLVNKIMDRVRKIITVRKRSLLYLKFKLRGRTFSTIDRDYYLSSGLPLNFHDSILNYDLKYVHILDHYQGNEKRYNYYEI